MSSSKESEQVSDVCFVCNKAVSDTDDGLHCEICEGWFHIKCISVAKKTYDLLKDPAVTNINWYCTPCNKASKKMLMSMTALEARQTNLEVDISQLTLDVNVVKSGAEVVNTELSKLGTSVNLIEGNLQQMKSDLKNELHELKDKLEQQIQGWEEQLEKNIIAFQTKLYTKEWKKIE